MYDRLAASREGNGNAPPRTDILQRTCACGGQKGPSGECDECRRKLLQRPASSVRPDGRALSGPGPERDFRELSVFPRAGKSGGSILLEEPVEGSLPDELDGEVVIHTTGGYSKCNLAGAAPVIVNNNDECARDCTQRHEESHVADWGGCCEQARIAHQSEQTQAAKNAVVRQWNTWINTNRPDIECKAYGVSVTCAREMLASHHCDRESSVCCDQINSYLTHVSERESHYCGLANPRTDCPY